MAVHGLVQAMAWGEHRQAMGYVARLARPIYILSMYVYIFLRIFILLNFFFLIFLKHPRTQLSPASPMALLL